jgi:hypothetical protein
MAAAFILNKLHPFHLFCSAWNQIIVEYVISSLFDFSYQTFFSFSLSHLASHPHCRLNFKFLAPHLIRFYLFRYSYVNIAIKIKHWCSTSSIDNTSFRRRFHYLKELVIPFLLKFCRIWALIVECNIVKGKMICQL